MNCANPIESPVLGDYWLALLPKLEEEAVEEHLFVCDECGGRLREVIALAEGVRQIAGEGSLLMVVSDTFVERTKQQQRRVREYTPPRGGAVECTVTADDDFLIGRLTADLSGMERLDLCLCDESGVEWHRLPDIPFQADSGSVVFHHSITRAKAAASEKMIARLVSLDAGGAESLLGEYTFNHTRSLPGPGVRF